MATCGDKQPSFALGSNLVYRLEVGLAVFGFVYTLSLALWLAWNGTGFLKLGAGPITAEAPAAEPVEGAASDMADIGGEFERFKGETEAALLTLDDRIEALEADDKRKEES